MYEWNKHMAKIVNSKWDIPIWSNQAGKENLYLNDSFFLVQCCEWFVTRPLLHRKVNNSKGKILSDFLTFWFNESHTFICRSRKTKWKNLVLSWHNALRCMAWHGIDNSTCMILITRFVRFLFQSVLDIDVPCIDRAVTVWLLCG